MVFTTPAAAGTLSGTVHIVSETNAPMQAGLDPYAGTLNSVPTTGQPAPHRTSVHDVVVYLTGPGAAIAPRVKMATPELAQINQSFQPHVLGIPVGTTVEFPNMDRVYHNVFSYSKTRRFDLGYYGKGKSKRVTFNKPGIVQVFCDIHSTMSAYVLVVDTPLVTQPGDDGNYTFPDLPDGKYTLTVWHPDIGRQSMTVTVGDGTTRADVNL